MCGMQLEKIRSYAALSTSEQTHLVAP
jgi:integrase